MAASRPRRRGAKRGEARDGEGEAGEELVPVFLRVKPLGAGGEDAGPGGGASSMKALTGYSEDPPTVVFDGAHAIAYPAAVVGPERSQADTFDAMMPELLDSFVNGFDVNLIAYGQTGSGKTHTLFGPPGLLGRAGAGELGAGVHEMYGLFPRTALRVLDMLLSGEGEAGAWELTASVVELHMTGNHDLLADKAHVVVDERETLCKLYGAAEQRVRRPEDLWPVFAGANSRATAATEAHDASSRSHCFVVLSLWRLLGPGRVRLSRLQFVDMAGSERLTDTSGPSTSEPGVAMWEGMMTNFTLLMLTQCIEAATSSQRRTGKTGHVPVRRCDLTKLLSGSVYGRSRTACVVALSQAPRNGMKGWLAAEWGEKLASLRVKARRSPVQPVRKVLDAARRGEAECAAALARGVAGRFGPIRAALLRRYQHEIQVVSDLLARADEG